VPALLISGSLDAVTAPPNAVTVAAGLPNAHVLDFPDSAHDVMIWSPACAVTVMHNFLDQPDGFDDSCMAEIPAPRFTVS
jgi:pimeloyl-ACP methyl ester carboxylesterase